MKKTLSILLALLLCILPLLSLAEADTEDFGGATLNVYNWGEYIDSDMSTIRNFEKMYNCRVNYKTYDSNESLYYQMDVGDSNWDVIVPSDYMIERMIREDLLQPLDKSIVTNLDNLADGVRNLVYDPDNTYSVPYLWQTVGIVYDKTKVDPAAVEEKGWDIFLDPAYAGHTDMYDSERDAFMIAFKALGYSMNSENEEEIQAAHQWLLQMDSALHPFYVTDEVIEDMAQGYKWLALVYSGDGAYVLSVNANMAFSNPKQGTNIAVDAMVIPAQSQNPRLANYFIKYMLDYEASLAVSTDVGYASANREVLEELSGPGGEYEGNNAYLPRSGYELDEYYNDSEVLRKELANLWIDVINH